MVNGLIVTKYYKINISLSNSVYEYIPTLMTIIFSLFKNAIFVTRGTTGYP